MRNTSSAFAPQTRKPRGRRAGGCRRGLWASLPPRRPRWERASWPVSRILFPAAAGERRRRGGDHPSGHTVAGCLERPTRRLGRAALGRLRSRTGCGLLALLRVGFTEPSRSPGMLVRSYRTVSPLPPAQEAVAVCSLWHCPASHLGLPLAITLLCEVRTFLDPTCVGPRPPGQLVRTDQRTARRMSSPTAGVSRRAAWAQALR